MKTIKNNAILYIFLINLICIIWLIFFPYEIEKTQAKIEFIKEFYQTSKNYSKVFLGDSTVAFGIDPTFIKNSISIALPGSTMFIVKNELERYSKNRRPPRCVIISTSSIESFYDSYFWKVYLASNLYELSELKDFYHDSEREKVFPAANYSYFTFILKSFFYRYLYYSPYGQLKLKMKLGLNDEMVRFFQDRKSKIISANGFIAFPPPTNTNSSSDNIPEVNWRHDYLKEQFKPIYYDDFYFKKIIDHTRAMGTDLYFVEMPIWNKGRLDIIDFNLHHLEHILHFPGMDPKKIIRLDLPLHAGHFRDLTHLNIEGAKLFSLELDKYLKGKCDY